MRELTLNTTKIKLKINGKEYTARMSDTEIIGMANDMQKRFADLVSRDYTVDEALKAAQRTAECIDMVLGSGAMAEISGGEPVSVRDAVTWLASIATAVTEEYIGKLVEQYG